MTISQVSKRCNISPDTLRYYEKEGLISVVNRTAGGVRDYTEQDCRQIEFVKCMRSAGLSIEVLRKYFELFKRGKRTLKARRDLLATERKALQERFAELQDTLKRLDYKISVYNKALKSKSKELKF
ncbi:MerR family transcriptional regulator [Candidatus Avelusimicrobium caledoniensis]|uniref:MerR family transcriptional regulator n=1 Tax=Candidatus Avelusimicrobium caledoniensis TaxID=3416220 RepID=UPI003D100C18